MLVSHAGAAARPVNARGGLGVFHDLGKLAIGTGRHSSAPGCLGGTIAHAICRRVAHKAFAFVIVSLSRGHVVDHPLDDRVPVFCGLTARVF
jgi:hypothetical protein